MATLLPVAGSFRCFNRRTIFAAGVLLELGVGDVTVDFAHVDGFVQRGATATLFAGILADAARGGRQGIIEQHQLEGVVEPVFLEQLEVAGDVHVQRAGVLAGREHQRLANARPASPLADVFFVFVAEISERGQRRVRRGLAESAQRGGFHGGAKLRERLQVGLGASAFGDARENFQKLRRAEPARCTLAATFLGGEGEEIARQVHHAGVLVHDNHAAAAHDRAMADQLLVINARVEQGGWNTAAAGAAGLHRLDGAAGGAAAAHFVNDLGERDAHRHFDQAAVADFAHDRKHLRAFALLGAQRRERRRAVGDDPGHVGEGLDVVDHRRATPESALRRERRTHPRHAARAFDGLDQRRFLAADKCPRAFADFDIELFPSSPAARACSMASVIRLTASGYSART